MMGVAQVMGMKPTLRSVFSGLPVWAKASVAASSGKKVASAAAAVEVPTAFRKARRFMSFGKSARMRPEATTSL